MSEKYKLNSKKNAIIDIDVSAFEDSTITFPAEIDGNRIYKIAISSISVSNLGERFAYFDVVIEEGIKNIEENMFANTNIRSITIPSTIIMIPNSCFRNSLLQKIDFSEDCKFKPIMACAFDSCSLLKSIFLPSSVDFIGTNAFKGSGITELIIPEGNEELTIKESAFMECRNLKKVVFQRRNVALGESIFMHCHKLVSVDMSNLNITNIPKNTFSYCVSLTDVKLPQSAKIIEKMAFCNCESLKTINISKLNIESIGNGAFESCTSYEDGTFPNTLNKIGLKSFANCGIQRLTFPKHLRKLRNKAFYQNPLTEGVDLSNLDYCAIGEYVFSSCGIKSVSISRFSAGNYMFSGCMALEEVHILEDAVLSEGIFNGCANLKRVTLPSTIKKIPNYAFNLTKNLNYINFPPSLIEIGSRAFYGSGLKSLDLSHIHSIIINSFAFGLIDLDFVKLPPYNCRICKTSFNEVFVIRAQSEMPFLTVYG